MDVCGNAIVYNSKKRRKELNTHCMGTDINYLIYINIVEKFTSIKIKMSGRELCLTDV